MSVRPRSQSPSFPSQGLSPQIKLLRPFLFSPRDDIPLNLQLLTRDYPIYRQIRRDGNAGIRALAVAALETDQRILTKPLQPGLQLEGSSFDYTNLAALPEKIMCSDPQRLLAQLNNWDSDFDRLLIGYLRLRMAAKGQRKWAIMGLETQPEQVLQLARQLQMPVTLFQQDYCLQFSRAHTPPVKLLYWKQTYALLYKPTHFNFPIQQAIFGLFQASDIEIIKQKRLVSIVTQQTELESCASRQWTSVSEFNYSQKIYTRKREK